MQEDFRALSAEMFDELDFGSDPSIRLRKPAGRRQRYSLAVSGELELSIFERRHPNST